MIGGNSTAVTLGEGGQDKPGGWIPIGVASEFALDRRVGPDGAKKTIIFIPTVKIAAGPTCSEFEDIDQMASIRWRLSADLPPGRYAVRARF
jgi:hypothetical protein